MLPWEKSSFSTGQKLNGENYDYVRSTTRSGSVSAGPKLAWSGNYVGAVWGKVMILVGVVLFLQWRPSGLFPAKGRAADV